jgi:tripartite-type tricarboxylate transporter receptor subunit TctC
MKLSNCLCALLLIQGLSTTVYAQAVNYPSKPVVLVNPYAVGGPTDLLGRTLAKGLTEQLGQQVLVENRAGGGASIGAAYVAKAAPDGYTLLLGTSAAHVVTPIATSVPYNGIKSFEFIGIVGSVPNILTVHNSMKLETLNDFLALAKSQPGKLSYASAGMGSSPHIGAELLKFRAGIDLMHIPYRGAAPAITDLVAGTVPVGMLNISVVQSHIKSGSLKALAYASTKRSPSLPNVPTFAEAGLPNFVSGSWYSLAAPANTPIAVLDRLAKALVSVQASAEFQAAATQQNAEIYSLSRADTLRFVQDDTKTMQDLIKTTGMKLLD